MARPADYGTKEQIFEIYSGVWGAAPDAEGVDYWVSAVDSEEFSLASAAASFFDQPLVQEKYEGLAGDDLLAALYANIFKVADPDADGMAYWTERMEALGVSESSDDAIGTLVMEMIDGMWANEDAADTQALYTNFVAASDQFYDFQVENDVQVDFDDDEAAAQFLAAAQELTDSITADSTAEEIEAAVAEAGSAATAPTAPSGLTEALGELQEATAGVATAEDNLNEYLEENGIDAVEASEEGVAEAREAVQEEFDKAVEERDSLRDETVGDLEENSDEEQLEAGVKKYLGTAQALTEANLTTAEAGVQAEIDADETVLFLDGDGDLDTVTEFDLNNATEGKDDTSVDQLLDLTNAATAGNNIITVKLAELAEGNKNSNGGGGSDTIILPKFADITSTVNLNDMIIGDVDGADSLVAEGLAAAEVTVAAGDNDTDRDAQGLYPYLTFTASNDGTGSVVFNNLINANTLFLNMVEAGDLEVVDGDGAAVSLSDLKAALSAPAKGLNSNNPEADYELVGEPDNTSLFGAASSDAVFEVTVDVTVDGTGENRVVTVNADAFANLLEGSLTGASFVEMLEGYGNLIAEEDVAGNLESVGVTLADLQQQMLDAENALSSARDAKSDFEVLDTVRAEISAYIAAGGNDVDDILDLRNAIRDQPDTEGFDAAEYELDTAGVPSRDELLSALAGDASLTDGEAVTEPQAEAPTDFDGQGTWVQGEEASEGTYEWTYEPTAEEQALLDALADVEAREELIAKEVQTEANFANAESAEAGTLGAQLLAIEARLEALAAAEQAVVDAQAELDGANELIDALEVALADLAEAEAWFTDQDMALPLALNEDRTATEDGDIYLFVEDTEEEGGFTITGFGEEGVDTLFFGAEANFSLVSLAELGEDVTIQDRVGDNDTLEIFWQETDAGLELFVEADKAAGFDRGDLALDQMTQITLTGVSAADITGFDGQTLTAGVAS